MDRDNLERVQQKLEEVTRKWWFLIIFILAGSVIPPITTKSYDPTQTSQVIMYILRHSLLTYCAPLYPIFKIIPILLVLGLIILGNRISRVFSLYVGITYILFAILQGVAITDKYGIGIITGNVILMILIAIFWFWEAYIAKNDFTPRKIPLVRYWVVPFAILAFWYPINPTTLGPDFNVVYLFTNAAGLAFCTMTPVYLSILAIYYPKVNIATLRVTSLLGLIIGFWNMIANVVVNPSVVWWNGTLHIPLVLISIYALILSYRKQK